MWVYFFALKAQPSLPLISCEPAVDTTEPPAAFLDESRTRSHWIRQLSGNQGSGLGVERFEKPFFMQNCEDSS